MPRVVQQMCQFVRTRIEIVIILRFVDPHPPQNDRGMIPIAPDHFPDVANRDVLPLQVPDVLPAGDLFENQQSKFIAGVQKIRRLWIVRGTDNVAMQVVLQYPRIAALNARRHGPADVRKRLMPVQPAQFHVSAVQPKP